MASRSQTINVVISAKDQISDDLDKIAKKAKTTNAELNKFAKGSLIFGGAIAGAFALATKAGMDFEKSVSNAFAATIGSADNTVQGLNKIRTAAQNASKAMPIFSAKEAADAVNELLRAGRSLDQVMGNASGTTGELSKALELAASDNLDLATATGIMSSTMAVWEKSGQNAASVADTLAAGAGAAQGGVMDMAESLKMVQTQAAASGDTLQETVGTLALLANNGFRGSEAGTALAAVYRNLRTPLEQGKNALEDLDIAAYDSSGTFRGLTPIMEDLQIALSGMSDQARAEVLSKIFDVRALRVVEPILKGSVKDLDGVSTAMRDIQQTVSQTGYAKMMADLQTDNLAGDWEKLKNTMGSAFIGASTASDSFVRSVVQGATDAINAWNGLPKEIQNGILGAVGGLGAIALATGGLIKAAQGVKSFIAVIKSIKAAAAGASGGVAGITKASLGIGAAVGLGVWALNSFIEKARESEARVQAIADVFEIINGQVQNENVVKQALLKGLQEYGNIDEIRKVAEAAGVGLDEIVNKAYEMGPAFGSYVEGLKSAAVESRKNEGMAERVLGAESWSNTLTNVGNDLMRFAGETEQAKEQALLSAAENEKLAASNGAVGDAALGAAGAANELAAAEAELAGMSGETAGAMQTEADKIREAIKAKYEYIAAEAGEILSRDQYLDTLDDMESALDKETQAKVRGKNVMTSDADAVRKLREQYAQMGLQVLQYASSVEQSTGVEAMGTAIREEAARKMYDEMVQMGVNKQSAKELAAQIYQIPKEAVTEFTLKEYTKVRQQLENIIPVIEGLPTEVKTRITAAVASGNISSIKASLDGLTKEQKLNILAALDPKNANKGITKLEKEIKKERKMPVKADDKGSVKTVQDKAGKTVTMPVKPTISAEQISRLKTTLAGIAAIVTERASGGAIYGPGTGTSDSILARLSNGEHVLTASDVRKMGGQDAVYRMRGMAQAGLLKFATGGAVGSYKGKSYNYWADRDLTVKERAEINVRLAEIKKELKAKEKYKSGKKTKTRDKVRGQARVVLTEEKKELEQQLKDDTTANALAKSVGNSIPSAIDKLEKAANIQETAAQLTIQARRGELAGAVRTGGGLSLVDQMRSIASSGDLTAAKQKDLNTAANNFEKQLIALYGNLDNATKTAQELQSIYDAVVNNLNRFDLAGTLEDSWTTTTDARGNQYVSKNAVTGQTIAGAAAAQASLLKTFAEKLHQLQLAGASPALMQQIASLDPKQGIEVANAFLQDRTALTSMNKSLANIATYSGQAGQYVTEASAKGGLAAANALVDKLNKEADSIGKKMADAFAKALGVSASSLQGRAAGGPVTAGTPYIVGEKGPELMVPSVSGTIVPNSAFTTGSYNTSSVSYAFNGQVILQETEQTRQLVQFMDSIKSKSRARR